MFQRSNNRRSQRCYLFLPAMGERSRAARALDSRREAYLGGMRLGKGSLPRKLGHTIALTDE